MERIPAGAFIALGPVLNRRADERRALHFVNGSVAGCLLVVFVTVSVGWGVEVYRCDIQQIPNGD